LGVDAVIQWYVAVLKKYAVFNGRAGRSEFWWFTLTNAIIASILCIPVFLAGATPSNPAAAGVLGLPYLLYVLAVLVPSLGLAIRRLHDTGRSGWWILITLVPFLGGIVLLIFYVLDSTPGDNQFGPHPRSEPMTASAPI